MTGSCEHDNESSRYNQCEKLVDKAE